MTKELPNPLVAAADNSPLVALEDLFREAIAYGAVYFPVIAKKQWDEMRDDKAKQLAGRAELLAADEREAKVRAELEADAEQALRKVLTACQRYLPPDGPSAADTLSEIIAVVDPWPLKGKL